MRFINEYVVTSAQAVELSGSGLPLDDDHVADFALSYPVNGGIAAVYVDGHRIGRGTGAGMWSFAPGQNNIIRIKVPLHVGSRIIVDYETL